MRTMLLALLLVISASACECGMAAARAANGAAQHLTTADEAVAEFHRRFNAGEFGRIWGDAADEFHKASTPEATHEMFSAVQRKLGSVQHAERKTWSTHKFLGGGTQIRVSYQVQYAAGSGAEHFVWKIVDGHAQLLSWNIQSRELILR